MRYGAAILGFVLFTSNADGQEQQVLIDRTDPNGGRILITTATPQPPATITLFPYGCYEAWPRSVVIGVRRDPLSAYADRVVKEYPYGVPVDERAFALWLFRGEFSRRLVGPPILLAPPPPLLLPFGPAGGVLPIQPHRETLR